MCLLALTNLSVLGTQTALSQSILYLFSLGWSTARVSLTHVTMDSLTTHPSNAQQARAFTSPASLSFPGGAGDLTPPSDKDGNMAMGAQGANGNVNGQQPGANAVNGNGVTPATPAATPAANAPGSGIVPTLQ